MRVPRSAQYFAKEMPINIRSLDFESEEYVAAVEKVQQEVGLTKVEDKQNKIDLPIADILRAIRYLDMQRNEKDYPMDGNGQHGFQSMRPEDLYATPASLRTAGVNKVSSGQYPCIYGYDIYNDNNIWETANQLSRIPNRLIGAMADKVWEIIGKHFDLGHHMPTEDTCFGLLRAAQDFFIEGQNILVSRKTKIRNATNAAIRDLSRTPAESAAQGQRLKHLIQACERASCVAPGHMEAEFMVDFIETQISTEQTKPYQNGGARVAMNDAFNLLSKEAADWPGSMTLKRVFAKVQATWIRVTSAEVTSGQPPISTPVPEAADPEQVRAERAMVVCAAQIIAEKNAKDAGRPHQPRGKPQEKESSEVAELRRQLSSANNQLQQLKQNNDKLKRARDTEGPPRSAKKGYGRQYGGYERKDSRSYSDRENRSPKDRSPPRKYTGYMAAVGADPRARSRSRSRSREFRSDEPSSRHHARRIRVKMIEPSPMIEPEPDNTPLKAVVKPAEENLVILTRSKTRAMAQVEVVEIDMSGPTTSSPTKIVSVPEIRRIGPVRPEKSVMIAWAYGTGSADQEEDDYNAYKMWEAHCNNPAANFIRRGEVMSLNAGISVCQDETLGARIGSFPWTGQDMDGIGHGEIWGTDEDEYILNITEDHQEWASRRGQTP